MTLPYPEPGGVQYTGGHSGSDTSRGRALREAETGAASERQAFAMTQMGRSGHRGITVRELRETFGWHHGTASGVLSNLHKGGHILRLEERRDGCKVYVLPNYSMGRPAESHGRHKAESESEPDFSTFLAGWIRGQQVQRSGQTCTVREAYNEWKGMQ